MHKAAPHPPTIGPELPNTQVWLRSSTSHGCRPPALWWVPAPVRQGEQCPCGLALWRYAERVRSCGRQRGLRRLAGAWHRRVMADEIVSHAFSHGFHPEHTERLAAYWAEALGGPAAYSGAYGDETSVVRIHSGNGLHEEMDRRAIACFDQATQDIGLTRPGHCGGCCTTTSPGPPQPPWRAITSLLTRSLRA